MRMEPVNTLKRPAWSTAKTPSETPNKQRKEEEEFYGARQKDVKLSLRHAEEKPEEIPEHA